MMHFVVSLWTFPLTTGAQNDRYVGRDGRCWSRDMGARLLRTSLYQMVEVRAGEQALRELVSSFFTSLVL